MNQCKRLSDCPADRLAQCRGQAVQDQGERKLKLAFVEAFRDEDSVRDIAHMADLAMRVVRECQG